MCKFLCKHWYFPVRSKDQCVTMGVGVVVQTVVHRLVRSRPIDISQLVGFVAAVGVVVVVVLVVVLVVLVVLVIRCCS